jgi:hypothetical protein
MLRQYTNVVPDDVIPTLKDYVTEKAAIARTAGRVGVVWPQLTVVFCRIRESLITEHSMLRFRYRATDTEQLFPDDNLHEREHLLFVRYMPNFSELTIYGDLTFQRFQSFKELGFITLGDLNTEDDCLSYPIDELEKQYLNDTRALECYFQPITDEHPNDKFSDRFSIEEKAEHISKAFSDVVGLGQSKERSAAMTGEKLVNELMNDLLKNKYQDVQYYYGLVLSAMHRDFSSVFVQMHKARLGLLIDLFFPTELKRMTFVKKWFPGVIMVSAPQARTQFYGLPTQCQFAVDEASKRDALTLDAMHRDTKPQYPYPGIAFTLPWELAHFAVDYPSVRHGQVVLSHYEILPALENRVEQLMLQQISYLQRKFHLCYAERYWNPVNSEMVLFNDGGGYLEVRDKLFRSLTDIDTEDEINNGMIPFEDMLMKMGRNIIIDVALPFLAGLSNLLSIEYFFSVWPPRKGLEIGNGEQFYLDNPDIAELHAEAVPETHAELAEFEYWPPCMRALVAQCHGNNHLKYPKRIRMVGQLRKFQYSPEQGEHLWTTIFSETDIYAAHGNQFLTSKQGKIVVEDYAKRKMDRIGVSCQAWIANGLCPLGKSGPGQDIEDIQIRCTGSFNERHTENNFPGTVQSPSDYFRMARKSLPRKVVVMVE